MYLENLVVDAFDPQRLGRFWQEALGSETLTDDPGIFETRLAVADGPVLDLCFQRVSEPPVDPPRLVPAVAGGERRDAEVERLLALGARRRADGASEDVLTDPEGNPFRLAEEAASYAGTGPLAAVTLDSADTDRDVAFWAWLTGWTEVPALGPGTRTLRHPSGRGPALELRPERNPQGASKNRMHLDVRLEAGEVQDDAADGIAARGGDVLRVDWGELPWRPYTDPSGNEFCVLPVSSGA
ncbi:VOC family protein [Nocardioides sp. HDW12B]|uniref:VOC family protein n=1 Tax=Nocardioides sp. HDW12B TaxID=2714939 RepID=UPI00140C435E|nr:VOC family protein [Nocardioides sp. HDW12B]QIK68041.1 VOC family protein [Nocardioides sp. HDW12B]